MLTLPMPPDIDDDAVSDKFYNSGLVVFTGHRDARGIIDGLDDLLTRYGLQIGFYDTGSTDVLLSVVPKGSTPETAEQDSDAKTLLRRSLESREALTESELTLVLGEIKRLEESNQQVQHYYGLSHSELFDLRLMLNSEITRLKEALDNGSLDAVMEQALLAARIAQAQHTADVARQISDKWKET